MENYDVGGEKRGEYPSFIYTVNIALISKLAKDRKKFWTNFTYEY